MGIYFSNPPVSRLHYQSCVYIPVAMLAVSDKLCLKCSISSCPNSNSKIGPTWLMYKMYKYTLKQNKTLITNKNIYILHDVAELAADK